MGVTAEIDLILAQGAAARLASELDKVSQQIGTGLAKGATPAALNFSKNLITTLQQRLAAESGVLAKQLADGVLTPAAYATKAQQLGREITRDLNRGLASGEKLQLFTGQAGQALRSQLLVPLTEVTEKAKQASAAVGGVGAAATKATPGLSTMRGALLGFASQAAGVRGPLGSLINGLLLFAGGGTVTLAIAAGLGVLALGFNKITASTTKAREATDQLIERFKDVGRSNLSPFKQVSLDIKTVYEDIARLEARLAAAAPRSALGLVTGFLSEAVTGNLKKDKAKLEELRGILRELVASQRDIANEQFKDLAEKRKTFTEELFGIVVSAGDKASTEIVVQLGKLKEKLAAFGKDATPAMRAAAKEAIEALETQLAAASLGESFAEKFRGIESSVVEGLGSIALQNIIGELDTLRAQIDGFIAQLPEGKARAELENQRNEIIARRNELQAKGNQLQGEESLTGHEILVEKKEDLLTDKDRLEIILRQARAIEQVAQGALQLADAFGLVDENMAKALESLVQIGANIPGALKGDPGSILSVAGGVAGAIGGIFKKSKDPERMAQNAEWFKAAMNGDEGALDELLQMSGHGDQGRGWATRKAKEDAWAKYQAAAAAQHEAAAPERAADAERAAEQAERDRLDEIREGEERTVAEREQTDELAGEDDLRKRAEGLGDAIMAQVAAAIAESRAADELARTSPLGEDSPLARDARRRADEAIREAERAVEDAIREKERLEGKTSDKVTPGYSVDRTITESSAGGIRGELTTANILAEQQVELQTQIRDILAEVAGAGGPFRDSLLTNHLGSSLVAAGLPTGASPASPTPSVAAGPLSGGILQLTIPVTVELDGQVLTEVVSTRQYQNFQHAAALQGNARMS